MMLKVGKSKIQIIFIDFCMFGVRYSAKDGVEKFILFEFFFSGPDKCHHIPSKITFLLDTFMASILDLKINNKVFFSVSFHSLSFHCASKRLLTQWKWRCVRGIPSAERKCFFYFWFLCFLMFRNFQYFIFSTILDFRLLFAECVNILFFLYSSYSFRQMVNSLFEVFRLNVCLHIEVWNIKMFYYYYHRHHQATTSQETFHVMFFLWLSVQPPELKWNFVFLIDDQPHRNEIWNLNFISISFSFFSGYFFWSIVEGVFGHRMPEKLPLNYVKTHHTEGTEWKLKE